MIPVPVSPRARRLLLPSALLLAVPFVLGTIVTGRPAAADDEGGPPLSGRREVRKALRDADDAMASGNYGQAAELYDQVVASTGEDDEQRGEALYGFALAEALRPAADRDGTRGADALRELADSFPGHERRHEIAAGLACIEQASRAGAEAARLEARVAELEAATAAQKARLAEQDAASDGRVAELEAEAGELRAEVARLRSRLATVEADLKNKEEALEKVKNSLVSGG